MKTTLLVLLTAAGTMPANVINFSSLSVSGTGLTIEGGSVTQGGFTFTSGASQFGIWDASSPHLPGASSADTSLFENSPSPPRHLKRVGVHAQLSRSGALARGRHWIFQRCVHRHADQLNHGIPDVYRKRRNSTRVTDFHFLQLQ